jgi:hypothetical protein
VVWPSLAQASFGFVLPTLLAPPCHAAGQLDKIKFNPEDISIFWGQSGLNVYLYIAMHAMSI